MNEKMREILRFYPSCRNNLVKHKNLGLVQDIQWNSCMKRLEKSKDIIQPAEITWYKAKI